MGKVVIKERVVPRVKTLKDYLGDDLYKIIHEKIKEGAAFVFISHEFSSHKKVTDCMRDEMIRPTWNGVAMYDAKVAFVEQRERPVIIVRLHKAGEEKDFLAVESVKLVGLRRDKTLWSSKKK